MKHIFEEYGDAIIQVVVLAFITLVLSVVTFEGVKGILNISGNIAEVDELKTSEYEDLNALKVYESEVPPTLEYNDNIEKGKTQAFIDVFTTNADFNALNVIGVYDMAGNDITSDIVNTNNRTLTFNNEGLYTIKVAVYGNKYLYKEFSVIVV